LKSADNQFGFKQGVSCGHAIYSTRLTVDSFIKGGNTANLCSLDLSKAFDKVNHHGLYLKLMKRRVPVELLAIFENRFSNCYACIKWKELWSSSFTVNFGVRQGSVLSPFLFSIYLDDLANLNDCSKRRFVIIYADDILLITQSLSDLQILLSTCEKELCLLDMVINIKKSFCSRIGPWCHINCARILSHDGQPILWTKEVRYLGVFIVSSRAFKCSLSHAKHSFFWGGGSQWHFW